jgi:methionine biosynthesis protein MetW
MTAALVRAATPTRRIRPDLALIAEMIAPQSRVLDVGCGDGALLDHLWRTKHVDGRGLELRQDRVRECVAHGLSVIQGDAETDLADYPSEAFDYAVLGQALQAMRSPREVLLQLARIGSRVIVSINNYGNWRIRWRLLISGHMPVQDAPAHHWYDTDNIHPCTLHDFVKLCDELGLRIERGILVGSAGKPRELHHPGWTANMFGEQGIFLLTRGGNHGAQRPPGGPGPR